MEQFDPLSILLSFVSSLQTHTHWWQLTFSAFVVTGRFDQLLYCSHYSLPFSPLCRFNGFVSLSQRWNDSPASFIPAFFEAAIMSSQHQRPIKQRLPFFLLWDMVLTLSSDHHTQQKENQMTLGGYTDPPSIALSHPFEPKDKKTDSYFCFSAGYCFFFCWFRVSKYEGVGRRGDVKR